MFQCYSHFRGIILDYFYQCYGAKLELEPVEPKLFGGTRARAVIKYFGSGSTAPEPKLSF